MISLYWIAHFEVPLNMKHSLSFNTIKKTQKTFESIFISNIVSYIYEICLLSAQLCICVSSPYQCSYTKLMVMPPTKLDITAQTQPRVRISGFKLGHHRAAHGIFLVRTSTDFSHHSSFRNGTSHSPNTQKNSHNRFENIYFKIFSQPQVKLVPVTLLQSTDQLQF